MTSTLQSTVRRETPALKRERGRYRPIRVMLGPQMIEVRLKGMRHGLEVSYEELYDFAAKRAADVVRREKRLAAKDAKGKAKQPRKRAAWEL
jgi:hypothetical protein